MNKLNSTIFIVAVLAILLTAFSNSATAQNTVEITLKGKTFVPMTATVNSGDTIRICNADEFFHRPFSYSKYNKFPVAVQIKPGECMTHVVQNPTRVDFCVKIFDELHSMEKLILTVRPVGESSGLTGTWSIVQTAPNGTRYAGTMKLNQSGTTLGGFVEWDNHMRGNLSGTIIECNKVKFSLTYGDGDLVGTYEGTLGDTGKEMINGSANSNKGGPTVSWHAGR